MGIEEKVERLTEMVSETNKMLARLLGEVTPSVEAKKYVNVAEASQMTGLSAVSLRNYCSRGVIASSKVGKYIMIPTASLYAYIDSTARKTAKEKANEVIRKTDKYHDTGRI